MWHAERVRDTACPCDSACVRGSARVGEKPCSRSTSPPSAPPGPRRRAHPCPRTAVGGSSRGASGRRAAEEGPHALPLPRSAGARSARPHLVCYVRQELGFSICLPPPALTSGAGLGAGSARGGLPVLPRGRGRSSPGLAEGKGACGDGWGRDGAGGCGPWRPALAGEPCQRCPASARPSAPAQVCAFPALARSLLRGQRIPLKCGARLKGCRGRGRLLHPAVGVRARPRRATSP